MISYKVYFNTDVMIINPKVFRNNFEKLLESVKFTYDNQWDCWEQDALNYLFAKSYLHLPHKFNYFTDGKMENDIPRAIFHFAGGIGYKPSLNTDKALFRLYLEYFLKTPWANVEMFGNIHKAVLKQIDSLKNNFLYIIHLLANRERAFITDKNNFERTKNVFAVKDNELIIDIGNFATPEDFLNHIKQYHGGDKIFFILSDNYPAIRYFMIYDKFVEGADFINGNFILPEQFGGIQYELYYSKAIVSEM